MKNLLAIMAVGLALLGTSACADLGFGVDYDMTDSNPYWSPSGYLGDYYWNTPAWNYGPIYNPRPPLIGNGPGSIILPDRPVRPPETIKPPKPNPSMKPGTHRLSATPSIRFISSGVYSSAPSLLYIFSARA